jgi:hypothetical protein
MVYVEHTAGVHGLPKIILREVRGCSAEVPFVERSLSLFDLYFLYLFMHIVYGAYFTSFLVLEFWFSIDFALCLRIYALLHTSIWSNVESINVLRSLINFFNVLLLNELD